MSEFFKAMAEFKPTPKKKHYFKNTEVTLKQYQEIQFHGEDNFEIVNGKVQRKKLYQKNKIKLYWYKAQKVSCLKTKIHIGLKA